jgi:hypothetical protein
MFQSCRGHGERRSAGYPLMKWNELVLTCARFLEDVRIRTVLISIKWFFARQQILRPIKPCIPLCNVAVASDPIPAYYRYLMNVPRCAVF